jgi:hypothetical protein
MSLQSVYYLILTVRTTNQIIGNKNQGHYLYKNKLQTNQRYKCEK